MPGTYVHISAMRHVAADLIKGSYLPISSDRINPEWTGQDTKYLGEILENNPNFAALGAIGPDFFFFLPDFRDVNGIPISSDVIAILNFLEKLYKLVDPYIKAWDRYLGPISEDTAEEMSRLTGGLSEVVGNITGQLSDLLIKVLEDFTVNEMDVIGAFSLAINHGWDEQAFTWADMFHYRETSTFARELWKKADTRENDGARAYALGFMSHIGADVSGHPFVNAISGGPFRLHWDRHHLVENHIDAYWYLTDKEPLNPRNENEYPQLTESALYYDISFDDQNDGKVKKRPFYPTGNTLRDNYYRRRSLDIDSELPDPLPEVILEAINEIYYQEGGKHPRILRDNDGRPSEDLIREAYRLLFRFLKYTTVDGFSHEPPDVPELFPNLDFPTPTDPNEEPPDDGDGSFCHDILGCILSVVNILAYIVEAAVYVATLPWAVLADAITYPFRLGIYHAFEIPLFHLLKNFRAVLVMTGYMLPMKDEIDIGLICIGNTNPENFKNVLKHIEDVFGGILGEINQNELEGGFAEVGPFQDTNYPYYQPGKILAHGTFDTSAFGEFRSPWNYPANATYIGFDSKITELCKTFVGPYPLGSVPDDLFKGLDPDPEILDSLEGARAPADADSVGPKLTPDKNLGDVIGFSKYIIWLLSRNLNQAGSKHVSIVNWNLDSDRGYGYQCWDWNRHSESTVYKDLEGNQYLPPCKWPQQSKPNKEGEGWHNGEPLQLHWTVFLDHGCLPDRKCEDTTLRRSDRVRRDT